MKVKPAESQLNGFIAKFSPEVAELTHEVITRMRTRLPGATVLVYDNYNALVIGFGPTERASEAIFSIAVYPRWINLFFLQGAGMPDPHQLLKGNGKQVRRILLESVRTLDQPEVRDLISIALEYARKPLACTGPGSIVIRSIADKQRPRRPPQPGSRRSK